MSALVCVLLACGDDEDPAPQTTPTGSVDVLDASVRDLPGDGTDPTPESDIDSRQRTPVGPQGLAEIVDRALNGGGAGGQSGSDSGTATGGSSSGGSSSSDPADAGTD